MDQTGDPTGTGTGGPGYTIADEYPAKAANAADQYPLGSVAMANTGSPHTGGSQFFIVAGPEGESSAQLSYSLFGQVTFGHERRQHDQRRGLDRRRSARRDPTHHLRHHPRVITNEESARTWPYPIHPPPTDRARQQRKFDQEPPMVIDTDKRYTATMVTSHGTMVIALDPLAAPKTVNSFVFLARYHYYDGVIFHRIIPGFVLQGGDPTGTGTGGPGLQVRGRAAGAGPLPGGIAGHGQRRSQHQREPVLRHQRAGRRAPARRSTPSSAPW